MSLKLLIALLVLVPGGAHNRPAGESERINELIANYAAVVDAVDVRLAAQVWDTSPDEP